MYLLRIHSVDIPEPYSSATATTSSAASTSAVSVLRCCVHLLRTAAPTAGTLSIPSCRSTTLFVASVPGYVSTDDFLLFCGSHTDHFIELCFLRNDGMEERYSVLITLANHLSADGFYCNYNGKRFRPSEAEICHLYFIQSAECFEYAEEANAVPSGYVELPTCPVCLERLDYDTSGIQTTLCDHSFQCPCVLKWTYLSCQVCRLCQQQDEKPSCVICGTFKNLWACVICGFVGCGRYEEKHAIRHSKEKHHSYSLELEKQQVWDYNGDRYVHRLNQSKIDGQSMMKNSSCVSDKGECGTCGCSEDSSIGGALLDSKVEAIMDEYNHLLATQMETQRQHYESLLNEAKSRKQSAISEEVEKALALKMEDLQSKLEKYGNEKVAVANKNQELIREQEILRKKAKEIEGRELASLKLMDAAILDVEEQIRDMTVYIEAQKKVSAMADSDGIRDGTVLPVQYNSSPSSNSRRSKSSRKRN